MQRYTQLTSEQRYQIYALLKKQHTQVEIALIVGVHKSTISRELKRNTGGRGYRLTTRRLGGGHHSFTESATEKGFGERFRRFMNSPGS